jgi:hypothetical protein
MSAGYQGQTIFIADAHRYDAKRLVVHPDEKLTGLWNWNRRFALDKLV